MFTPITAYTLATHQGPYAERPLTTPLLRDGVPTGASVPGYVIEGQYQWREYVLLLTSWDCPFEESCDIVLLDQQHTIVARASLGAPYCSFLLHAHWPIDDVSLRLHFYRTDFYTLTIRPPGDWRRRQHDLRLHSHAIAPTDERTQASLRALQKQIDALKARDD